MRSATLLLPILIMLLINLATSLLPYLGSGNMILLGTSLLLGISLLLR